MKSFLSAVLIAGFGAAVTAAFLSHGAVRSRFDLVRHKVLGRLPSVGFAEVLTDLGELEEDVNRTAWVTGYVRLLRADLEAPCPALWDTPYGRLHGSLVDEHDLEWLARKYMLIGTGSADGLVPVVEPGDTVLELGAWVGMFSQVALTHGARRVIAVEPVPANLECLRRSFPNEIADGRLTLVEAAAWHENGEVEMVRESEHNPFNSTKGYNIVESSGQISVPARTIDSIVEELGLETVDLMNLDIEGAERYALAGARETIQRFAPEIVVCIHHKPGDDPAVLDAMRSIRPEYRIRRNGLHVRYY